ncbi:cytochrome P450 87A3-like [Papaver somniferum]|uniref:cytochrome P450 87A3-like n=1 Tax=Papaver somniferum TaxID=3469 RepID=UPI000E704659|nr:cytochrome P450 87A3-like [Papaver somniferum]
MEKSKMQRETPTWFHGYGTMFRTSLAGHPVVVSSDPDFNYFIFQQERKSVELWYMDSFSAIFGGGLECATDARIHKHFRNAVLNHFGTEALKEKLLPKIEMMSYQALESWSNQPSVELKSSITSMIFDLTSKHLFNYDSTKSTENLSLMFASFFKGLMTFPVNIPGTAFHRCMQNQKKAMKLMKDVLHKRRNSPQVPQHGDFLDQVLEDMKKEDFLTDDIVMYLIFGLLLASFASISVIVTSGMTFVTDHPLVAKELLENASSLLTWKELKSMTYMSQVITETLRMSSIGPGILRKAIKDIDINGYVIPKGWTIMVVPSAIHMNPDKYKDPFAFNPARWNDPSSNMASKNFIPFGFGLRNCVGAEFNKSLMGVFLHVLLTKFTWTKIKGGNAFGDRFHVQISKKDEIKANTAS